MGNTAVKTVFPILIFIPDGTFPKDSTLNPNAQNLKALLMMDDQVLP